MRTTARKLNSKIYQCRELERLLPVVDFRICETYADLLGTTDTLWKKWTAGIFVSMEYSAAGINSTLARSQADITQKFGPDQAPFIISRYVPHTHDPTVLAVVAGEEDVYVAGIADQHIEGGNRFTGSSYPSVLPAHICDDLRHLTVTTGQWLADQGYRGIFGCDYIVDNQERIYPSEAYQEAIAYIQNNPLIRDVLITGGDAFVLPNKIIRELLEQLDGIEHLKMKRLGTRIPVTAPQRVDDELLEILTESNDKKPLRVVTQINTAQEITPISREAFRKLSKSAAAVLNQAVLLKGVNDSRVKMWKLCETIQESYVRPYYIFNCSYRNPQLTHFRVPVEKGRDIVESMYGNISGDAIPRYIATAGGKIPLHKSNVVGTDNGEVVLKKPWNGQAVNYPDADPGVYANQNYSFRKP